MPRRTSLDASKWKELENNENSVPTLWELCVERLLCSKRSQSVGTLSMKDQKKLALKCLEKKKLTRESLMLFSASTIASCVRLDLSNTSVTDSGLYLISGLSGLTKLQLHNCKNITNTGLSYLRSKSSCTTTTT